MSSPNFNATLNEFVVTFNAEFSDFIKLYHGIDNVWIGDGTDQGDTRGERGVLYAHYVDNVVQRVGPVSAYYYAVESGYEGSFSDWVTLILNTSNNAQSAAASAESALSSKNDAASSKAAAASSATSAASSATSASNYASNASTSASNAASSATAAANSATSASNSASSASSYSSSAQSYAEAASTSATSAGNSATSASDSATAASNSATSASNSATSAGNSATSAGNSATLASSSASTANSAATTAVSAKNTVESLTSLVILDFGTIVSGSLPRTISDQNIENTLQVVRVDVSNPNAFISDPAIEINNGSATLYGSVATGDSTTCKVSLASDWWFIINRPEEITA